MIVSDLTHWDQEKHMFHPSIQAGIEYIRQTDFEAVKDGTYAIRGDSMFAIVQTIETQAKSFRTPESHEMFVDIQCLLHGEERIGTVRANGKQRVSQRLLGEKDLLLYEVGIDDSELLLTPGMFAVFLPADVHRPCCSVTNDQTIRKVVIKIHKNLWLQDGSGR
ncbi:YhcH/YjgK/YiaL family protein [Paenibacillus allorhizosphaerae]|uniref:DUF386 domain-containing protein n=1 Tax=Paenibacillus allorhizosphaerae TaxID=2849866 RepID=A0ABN7TUP3_9BACL|nr:YhcH/YjgK/YiaL family protein [Paenibacillus allorhizosphaerae]CAG7656459.1 hypothetical protein PAECIP111802_06409 [Paenibacillus allorhizosphaerae]